MQLQDLRRAIVPLKLIFWGAVLCLVDVSFSETTNGTGWRIDVISDLVGMILITVGVFRLGAFQVHGRYMSAMAFVKVMAVLGVVEAAADHIVWNQPLSIGILLLLIGLATLAAIMVFCIAMRWLCIEAGLDGAARSWRTTLILFIAIYVIPLGVFYLAGLIAVAAGRTLNLNVSHPALVIVAVAVFFVPIIHLLVSTVKMAHAIGSSEPPDEGRFDDTLTGAPAPPPRTE